MDEPVLTMVTATVPPGSEAEILATFRLVTTDLPPEVLHTFLLRGEANEWSVASLWRGREQHEHYLGSVETQGAIELFRIAGGDPRVTTFDVVHQSSHPTDSPSRSG